MKSYLKTKKGMVMRRSAQEYIRHLEARIARLERQAMTKKEEARLDELQRLEDQDSLNRAQNKEYEDLVEKYRKFKGRQAGSGLKSVQKVLPNVSDRQANQFLHALSSSIVTGDILKASKSTIKGEILVDETPTFSNPSMVSESYEDGVVGVDVKMVIEIAITDLARLAKIDLSRLSFSGKSAVEVLCKALSKNIDYNIMRNMTSDQMSDAFDESEHEVMFHLPRDLEASSMEVSDYDYEVKGLALRGNVILATVSGRIVYEVIAQRA